MEKKTKKQRLMYLWLSMVAVIIFLGFGACKEDEEEIKCLKRTDTAIDDINCGGKNCICSTKIYGYIVGIPIYREKGVTDAQATEVPSEIFAQYEILKNETIDPIGAHVENINTASVSAIYLTVNKEELYPYHDWFNGYYYLFYDWDDTKICYLLHSLRGNDLKNYLQDLNYDWIVQPQP